MRESGRGPLCRQSPDKCLQNRTEVSRTSTKSCFRFEKLLLSFKNDSRRLVLCQGEFSNILEEKRTRLCCKSCSYLKIAVFLDVTSCGSCKKRRFGVMYHLCHKSEGNQRTGNKSAVTSKRSTQRRNILIEKSLPLFLFRQNNAYTMEMKHRQCYQYL
jgi:hypothetical protein